MKDFFTVREAGSPEHLNRSANWIRSAIRLGKIKAEIAGSTLLMRRDEIDKLKQNLPVVSRKEINKL